VKVSSSQLFQIHRLVLSRCWATEGFARCKNNATGNDVIIQIRPEKKVTPIKTTQCAAVQLLFGQQCFGSQVIMWLSATGASSLEKVHPGASICIHSIARRTKVHPIYSKVHPGASSLEQGEYTEDPSPLPLILTRLKSCLVISYKENTKHPFAYCPMSISKVDFILQDFWCSRNEKKEMTMFGQKNCLVVN